MRDRCWSCKKWEEHFYWDHFEESNFHFMKVMDGDFNQKMEFPKKFTKNFRVELIDVVALEAPNGKLWEISLCKEQDNLYFNGGWKNFIEANEIEEAYILVFAYAGDSRFRVQIFDQIGRVKFASNMVNNVQTKQKNLDQIWQNFQDCAHSLKISCDDHPMLQEQATDNSSASSTRFNEEAVYGMGEVKDGGRVESSRICKEEAAELQSEAKLSLINYKDKLKILELKFASKQGNGSFVKLITESNIKTMPFMSIPAKFVAEHIPQKPYGISVCNQSNKKWYVHCSKRSSSWGFYGKSLFNLLQENKIRIGDACVFELFELKKKTKTVVMVMRIVRAKEVCSIFKNKNKKLAF